MLVLVIAILNDGKNIAVFTHCYDGKRLLLNQFSFHKCDDACRSGTIMTISKDKVKPSPHPDSWKLAEIFATGVIIGVYLAVTTVLFFWAAYKTDFFVVTTIALTNSFHYVVSTCSGDKTIFLTSFHP